MRFGLNYPTRQQTQSYKSLFSAQNIVFQIFFLIYSNYFCFYFGSGSLQTKGNNKLSSCFLKLTQISIFLAITKMSIDFMNSLESNASSLAETVWISSLFIRSKLKRAQHVVVTLNFV